MFWDRIAGVYDIYVNIINRKTHRTLCRIVSGLIDPEDEVLECACGTGMLSKVTAAKCRHLTATDFSEGMLKKARKNCAKYSNIIFEQADITGLPYRDGSFDKVIAGNVIHLLEDPLQALRELDRVCRTNGKLIIPTYMNKEKPTGFVTLTDHAGADFKQQFTAASYRQFFLDAGYNSVQIIPAEGFIPCAVAVMTKNERTEHESI